MAEEQQPRVRSSSLKSGRVLGIELRVHWSFTLLLVLVVGLNASLGASAVARGLLWIAAIFGSVLIHELAMAIAGPLMSFGLAAAFSLLSLLTGAHLLPPTLLAGSWLVRLTWLNLLLGAFNLLPALPMDGGRVLRAALAMHEDRRRATVQAAKVARVIAAAMIALGLVWDVWLVLIGAFVLFAAGAEERSELEGGAEGDAQRG